MSAVSLPAPRRLRGCTAALFSKYFFRISSRKRLWVHKIMQCREKMKYHRAHYMRYKKELQQLSDQLDFAIMDSGSEGDDDVTIDWSD